MKFAISFFLCCKVMASPIFVYYESDVIEATMLKDILMNDYHVPEELITVKGVRDCSQIRGKGKLDLCLKNNGDLLVVSVDRNFINESLKVFQAP